MAKAASFTAVLALCLVFLAASASAAPRGGPDGGISISLEGLLVAAVLIVIGAIMMPSHSELIRILGIIIVIIGIIRLITSLL